MKLCKYRINFSVYIIVHLVEPGAASDTVFLGVQTTRVTISWTPPTGRVTDYNVTALRDGTKEGSPCPDSPSGNAPSRHVCDLRAGSRYTFNVIAISGDESGEIIQASQTLGK